MSQEYAKPYAYEWPDYFYDGCSFYMRNISTTTYTGYTAGVLHLWHFGNAPATVTGCQVMLQVSSTTGTSVAWGELSVWKGFFPESLTSNSSVTAPFEDPPTLTKLGVTNLVAGITTSGYKTLDCAFTAANCNVGDEIWLGLGYSAGTCPNFVVDGFDFLQSGRYFTFTGQASGLTTVGPGQLAWGLTSVRYARFGVMFNG